MNHPAPDVPCRPAMPEETPKTARRLALKAQELGWTAATTFARGTSLDQYGGPSSVVDCVAVRLRRTPIRAVGLWHDGKFRCGLLRLDGSTATVKLKARQLTAVVTS